MTAPNAAAWVAEFDGGQPVPGQDRRRLRLIHAPADGSPAQSQRDGCWVIFDGSLHNRGELCRRFANLAAHEPTDADLAVFAYQAWGADALQRLRGVFALIVWDSVHDRLLCARDCVGLHPLFYADAGCRLVLSSSIDAIVAHPDVPRTLNRPGLVDHLARRWLDGDETYFAHVKRVPPCHVLQIDGSGRRVYRYWDPAPPGKETEWIPDDDAQRQFDRLLEQAVARCLGNGLAGINLSGGIDSSSVAMIAADLCRRERRDRPWALSLVLPGSHVDEAADQQAVAAALDMPHLQLSFEQASGPEGAFAAALDMSRGMPAPVSTTLRTALFATAVEGRRRGCTVILTGDGADEWVGVNPYFAGDLLRSMDCSGLYRLWRTYSRSYPFSTWVPLHSVLWGFGARPLLQGAWDASRARALARSVAPRAMDGWRRWRMARLKPAWIAPDPTLAAEVDRREAQWWARVHDPRKPRSLCLRFARSILDLPQKWMFHEETFAFSRRTGVRVAQPFWDADLIDALMRIRPQARIRGNLNKSLLRGALVARFPELGFERRLKSYTGDVILSTIRTRAAAALQTIGRTSALVELGVVDADRLVTFLDRALAEGEHRALLHVWDVLNLETWARAHG